MNNSSGKLPYHRMTIEQLQSEYGFVNWQKIIAMMSTLTKTPITEIMIDHKEYMQELNILFNRYSLETIDNYLCWAKVAKFLPYLGSRFRRAYADFRREVPDLSHGMDSIGPSRVFLSRWKECVHVTCEGLKLPSSLLYLINNKDYLTSAVNNVKTMVNDIKNAFFTLVDRQNWLNSPEIKRKIKERAKEINSKVGFPEIVNSDEVDKLYLNFSIDTSKVFVVNIIKMAEHEIYLDYATLGVVIGHEIAHSFYNELKKEMNTDTNLWTIEMNDEYERRTQCFADQFSSYTIEEIGENLSGNQTLEENICDFAGLQQAYTAYRSNLRDHQIRLPGLTQYNSDQMFFIQYAQIWCEIANEDGHRKSLHDSHAPGKFRANGVVVNTDQYATAFACEPNSPMNPENKCKLWSAM
ncbi:endothelin-converting enzyme 2-like isoform X2 [Dinothrombium tinctorium]|uniref:Endothelin-converting enzyme 2-like isoform X2 n=1 Tax=Dinothrombium tinctorium TaxID=1965070 RepID=A0A3S3P7L3_9ACAR|nr:endothelin-converting enzyme 2-like isoform X2 [Dinothrombium tinctorium]